MARTMLSDEARLCEAVLFIENQPLSMDRISELTGIKPDLVEDALQELRDDYMERSSGLMLTEDDDLYNFLVENRNAILKKDRETVSEMVGMSLRVKASYIERDPEEKFGIRQALNLGHTFAHALETTANFSIKHGIAVAWGLSRAAYCGAELGITSRELQEKIDSLLSLYSYDISYRIGRGEWLDFYSSVGKDKKRLHGGVKFVLLESQGHPVLRDLDQNLVRSAVISAPSRIS